MPARIGSRSTIFVAAAGLLAACSLAVLGHGSARTEPVEPFQEIAAVLEHPRCLNCHTLTGFPKQGDDRHRHTVNVMRGADGHGAAGLACATCHGRQNNRYSGVPGANEDWHLAPLSMGWEGLPPAELCRHLMDPARNGGRTGADIIAHLDSNLVRWAWSPGVTRDGTPRDTPPGSHDAFVTLMENWVKAGARCPNS
jgi:hypothetical protein